MSDVPVWTCEMAKIDVELEKLTAGDRFALNCHGDIAVDWSADRLATKFAKPDQEHALDILSAPSLKPQSVQLIVTGYRAGEHTPEYVRVMQGERGFEFVKPKWKIESVLDPKEQPPKPAASLGPVRTSMPAWLPWVNVGGIALLVALIGWATWRFFKRRRFREDLKKLDTALPAIREFYKDARGLRRRLEQSTTEDEVRAVTKDLDRKFRTMLTREFKVPALEWSDARLTKHLVRKRRPLMKVAGDPLKKTLRELSRLISREKLNQADVDQTLRMAIDTAEKLDRGEA